MQNRKWLKKLLLPLTGIIVAFIVACVLEAQLGGLIFIEPDSGARSWWISILLFVGDYRFPWTFSAIFGLLCCAGVAQGIVDGRFRTALPLSVLSAAVYGLVSFGYARSSMWMPDGVSDSHAAYHFITHIWPIVSAFVLGAVSGVLLRCLIKRVGLQRKQLPDTKPQELDVH